MNKNKIRPQLKQKRKFTGTQLGFKNSTNNDLDILDISLNMKKKNKNKDKDDSNDILGLLS